MPHLMLLKEVTDQGRLSYDHPLGLCLVAAGRGNTIPLKVTLDQPEPTWLQWRRRLDSLQPFCRIASHTSEEVRDILATLEQVYQPLLPQLNLRQWTSSIYMLSVEYHFAFLTNKFFARLLERSQWSQLKLHSSEMALTQNFSRQNRAIFLSRWQTRQRKNALASDANLFARLSERASGAALLLPQNLS